MRTIKFRAWNTKGGWEGKIIPWEDLQDFHDDLWELLDNGNPYDEDVGKFELMQFTGLLDKNGKEIYEGDILKNEVKNCKVEWSEMNLAWVGVGLMAFGMNGDGEYEIIGNIYENPELLK